MIRASSSSPVLLRRIVSTLCGSLLFLAGCTDGELATGARESARIALRPYYASSAAHQSLPINRLRLTIRTDPSGSVVRTVEQDVDPSDNVWKVTLEVPASAGSSVSVLVELINAAGSTETVEFSGIVGPIAVQPGVVAEPPQVAVFPGPPANLNITALQIADVPALSEGASAQLAVNVVGGSGATRVIFTSLDPTLASVDDAGRVTALLPGMARIVGAAGRVQDTVTVAINVRPASMSIDPASVLLTSIGDVASFHARVLDPRGGEITNAAIVYAVSDAAVATSLGNGEFRAEGTGRATITASGPDGLTASAEIVVEQQAAVVDVSPAAASIPVGATAAFAADVRDARDNPMPGATVQWSSSDPSVATIANDGVLTALRAGSVTVSAQSGAAAGTAAVTVTQAVTSVGVSPATVSLNHLGQTAQLTATPLDANGNVVPDAAVTWSSAAPGVATVDQSGSVRAVSNGTAVITATSNGISGTASVTVAQTVAAIEVSPPATTLTAAGATVTLNAVARDGSGHIIAGTAFTWSSSDTAVATVNQAGTVTAVGTGSARITAASGAVSGAADVTVTITRASGMISGIIQSAGDGLPVAGAAVELRGSGAAGYSTTSGSDGSYSFADVDAGSYTVVITAEGFAEFTSEVTIDADDNVSRNFVILPLSPEGEISIVLSWGATPRDLDSHLLLPARDSQEAVIIGYNNPGSASSYPFATLDVDDTDGHGPETITIVQQLAGDYVYFVNNYSEDAPLSASGATVEVYRGNTRIGTFTVPNQPGTQWVVFALNGSALIPLNQMSGGSTGQHVPAALRVPLATVRAQTARPSKIR